MFTGDHGDRTVAPSARRLAEARRAGASARSSEFTASVSVGAAAVALILLGPQLWSAATELLHAAWSAPLTRVADGGIPDTVTAAVVRISGMAAALLAVACGAAVVANVIQAGMRFEVRPPRLRFSAVSPSAGLRRLLSAASGREAGALALKLSLTTWLVYRAVRDVRIDEPVDELSSRFTGLGLQVAVVLATLAMADWMARRRQFHRGLRLTQSEARREARDSKAKTRPRTRRPPLVSALRPTADEMSSPMDAAEFRSGTERLLQKSGALPSDPLFP